MASVLVIEDSDGQRAEVRAALDACGLFDEVLEASDGIQGLRLLLSASPDLVLCDLEMPGLDGEKLLRMNQDSTRHRRAPFLVLTAVTDAERRARLLERGASDAITKPFHTADLIARIGLHLKLVQAESELLAKNAELEHLSRTDALTGLANRRQLEAILEDEFKRAQRYQTPFAVAMGDIDRFKSVNDEFGHLVGDQVIVAVAGTLDDMIRETDCAGRYGGEEFLAILSNNDCEGAHVFAERWRWAVGAISLSLDDGRSLGTQISIGISCWRPTSSGAAEIVRRADEALYAAKESGRNRVRIECGAAGVAAQAE